MSRRKILFAIPSMTGGGAERVFLNLLNNLDRERYEVALAVGARHGEFIDKIAADVEIFELNAERARAAVPPLVRTVRRFSPQTVVSTVGMNFAATLGKKFFPAKTRVVLREGSSPTAFLADVERINPLRAKFYRQCYRHLYKFADAVICQSDFMRDDIERNMKVPAAKLHRIYNPVNFAQIDKSAAEPAEFFSPAPDEIRLITVGRLAYEKAYDNLLRAFAVVRETNPNATLTFIGKGDEEHALKNLARELNLDKSARFLGFQASPHYYVKRSDIFILSSRYEGFSNVIIEALACGVPVVATDCPSANREVIVEGLNGWFAENENVSSLAETINRAIVEKKFLSADAIRRDCESRFALEKILPQFEKLLEA